MTTATVYRDPDRTICGGGEECIGACMSVRDPLALAGEVVRAFGMISALRVPASELEPGDVIVEPVFDATECVGHQAVYVTSVVRSTFQGRHEVLVSTSRHRTAGVVRTVRVSPAYTYPRTGRASR